MCVSSDSNIVFPCKICNIIINNKDSVTSASFGFTLNVVNYDPWYCISCCDEILPFGKLPNKSLLSLVNPDPDDHDCFTNNSDAYISKNSSYHQNLLQIYPFFSTNPTILLLSKKLNLKIL